MKLHLWDKTLKEILVATKKFIYLILSLLYSVLYCLIIVSLPIYLLYKWNFDYAREINEFIKNALWPLTVIFLALLFKDPIKEKIKYMKKAATPMGDVEFADPNEQLKESSEAKAQAQKLEKKVEGRNYDDEVKKLQTQKDEIFLKYHFERTYRVVFGSQLAILSSMSNDSNHTITESLARLFHKNHTFSQTYSYEAYMAFLIDMGLIEYNHKEHIYTLTNLGSLFLGYLQVEKINLAKQPW